MWASSAYLMLTGGFAVSAGNALGRKDAVHMFAFAFAALGSAMLAGVTSQVLAWACVVFLVALAMFGLRALVRLCTGADGFAPALTATALLSLLLIAGEKAPGPFEHSAARPSAIGRRLVQGMSGLIVRLDRPSPIA